MSDSESVQLVGTTDELTSLPPAVRCKIDDEGLKRLRGIRDNISRDARFRMPPIRAAPWGLVTPNRRDAVWGHVSFANCGPVQKGGASLPTSALFAIEDDDLLRGLVVHEFAHSFWCEVQFLRSMFDGAEKISRRYRASRRSSTQGGPSRIEVS